MHLAIQIRADRRQKRLRLCGASYSLPHLQPTLCHCTVTMSFRIALRFTLSSSNKWALPGRCSYRQSLATARPEHLRHSSSSSKRPTVGQTDDSVRVQYPEDADLPATRLTQGRGGQHYKRTLATFSLEKRVVVVTGGARGLGLVMSQAIIASGADVALVDINGH